MADVTLGITLADGSIYRSTGFINIQSYQNQDGKLTVDLIPRNNSWALFAGTNDAAGTIKAASISGVTYEAAADADITFQPSQYKNEAIVGGAGSNMRKMTRQPSDITGLVLLVGPKDVDAIRQIAEG